MAEERIAVAAAGQREGFTANWTTARNWSESGRYNSEITESEAKDLFLAITDPTNGVLPWLKKYW
jgi:hypothetical protein